VAVVENGRIAELGTYQVGEGIRSGGVGVGRQLQHVELEVDAARVATEHDSGASGL